MRKYTLLLAFLLLLGGARLSAQSRGLELGLGFSPLSAITVDDAPEAGYKLAVYAEYRFGLGRRFDLGAKVDYKLGPVKDILPPYDEIDWNPRGLFTHSLGLMAVADVNILPGRIVNPFIGVCFGPGVGLHNVYTDGNFRASLFATVYPRIGIELFEHIRISLETDISFQGGNLQHMFMPVCFNVGWAF